MATNNAINKKSDSITFDGTNVLSSYVTATAWTPDLQFGGAKVGITYASQVGYYMRIGNIIFFNGYISLTSNGSSTGEARIYGLPVAAAQHGFGTTGYGNVTFTGDSLYWQIDPSNTYIVFQKSSNASGALAAMTNAEFENDSAIRFSGFYFV